MGVGTLVSPIVVIAVVVAGPIQSRATSVLEITFAQSLLRRCLDLIDRKFK